VYRKARENAPKTKAAYKCVKCNILKCKALAWINKEPIVVERVVNEYSLTLHVASQTKQNLANSWMD
jgi:hypothetical protein